MVRYCSATCPNISPPLTVCEWNCSENTDGYVVKIVVTDEDKCEDSAACFEYRQTEHIAEATIYIEGPLGTLKDGTKIAWTMNPNHSLTTYDELTPFGPKRVQIWYLPGVMTHEMGHSLGALDFYLSPAYRGTHVGVMNKTHEHPEISEDDKEAVRQAYVEAEAD